MNTNQPAEDIEEIDVSEDSNDGGDVEGKIAGKIGASDATGRDRPTIILRGEMREQLDAIQQWLMNTNDPPHTFKRGRDVVRVVEGKEGRKEIEMLNRVRLRSHFSNYAQFAKLKGKENRTEVQKALPRDCAEFLLAESSHDLPELEYVYRCPVYARGRRGAINMRCDSGFHEHAKAWIDVNGVDGLEAPESPTSGDVQAAKSLLLDDLLVDFPFDNDASKTNAIALGLLPFVRPLIDGPTPLHMISAPTPGSGKGLLVSLLSIIAEGERVSESPAPNSDDEWRKRITAMLAAAPSYILLDNISEKMESGALASALTSRVWSDRWLGESRTVRLRNDAVWAATANNPAFSGELARRMMLIRIVPTVEAPEERTDFKHSDIRAWAHENRARLVNAFLVLVEHWIDQGMPDGSQTLGSYEGWARVVGGILESCGFDGFMGNREKLKTKGARETEEWRRFVRKWNAEHGLAPVYSADLRDIATQNDLLAFKLDAPSERGRSTQMTMALQEHDGRVYEGYQITREQDDTNANKARWRLQRVK